VDGVSPIVSILPTGGGKTTLIMVPATLDAMLDDRLVNVVVVPLVAVANEMQRTLKKAGIYTTQWDIQSTSTSTVVIVSAETATSKGFAKYVAELYLSGTLARVFFDEAHLIITDVGYREKLGELKKLRVPIQLVLLTATLPPSYQKELE
jgi:superfamily II DNA helicase RecQ